MLCPSRSVRSSLFLFLLVHHNKFIHPPTLSTWLLTPRGLAHNWQLSSLYCLYASQIKYYQRQRRNTTKTQPSQIPPLSPFLSVSMMPLNPSGSVAKRIQTVPSSSKLYIRGRFWQRMMLSKYWRDGPLRNRCERGGSLYGGTKSQVFYRLYHEKSRVYHSS